MATAILPYYRAYAVPALVHLLADEDEAVRGAAQGALASIGSRSISALRKVTSQKPGSPGNSEQQWRALYLLCVLQPDSHFDRRRVAAFLTERSGSIEARRNLIEAIGDGRDTRFRWTISDIARDATEDSSVVAWAIWCLGVIGNKATAYELVRLLNTAGPDARKWAYMSLQELGEYELSDSVLAYARGELDEDLKAVAMEAHASLLGRKRTASVGAEPRRNAAEEW